MVPLPRYPGLFRPEYSIDLERISGTSDMKIVKDMHDRPLLLFVNEWSVGMTLDRNENLKLAEFSRN